jgi:hypothetical protein
MSTAVITSWIERFVVANFTANGSWQGSVSMQVLLMKEKSAGTTKHQIFVFDESVDQS